MTKLLIGLAAVVAMLIPAGAQQKPPSRVMLAVAAAFDLFGKGQVDQAKAEFERLTREAATEKDAGAEAEAWRGLCRVARRERRLADAKAHCQRALEIAERARIAYFAGQANNDLGILAFDEGSDADVKRYFERAAERFEAAGAPVDHARALTNITFAQSVPVEDKLVYLERAAAIGAKAGNKVIEGNALHSWGDFLFVQGRYGEAVDKITAAVTILEAAASTENLARAFTSLGRALRAHGHPERALEVYKRGLALQAERKDLSGQVQSHNALATSLEILNRTDEALAHRQEALRLAEESKVPRDILNSRAGLGIGYASAGRYADAEPLLRAALAADPSPAVRPIYRSWLATTLAKQKQFDGAMPLADAAVTEARELKQVDVIADVLLARAIVRRDAGRIGDALADSREALTSVEELRKQLAADDFLKQGFSSRFREVYEVAIDLLVSQNQHAEALAVAEQGRARAFVDLLASRQGDSNAVPLTLRSGNVSGLVADTGVDAQLSSAVSTGAATAADIVQIARALQSTVISYWVQKDATYAWIVSPDGRTSSHRIAAKATELESLVRQTTQSLGGPTRRGVPSLVTRGGDRLSVAKERTPYRRLYEALVKPLEAELPKTSGAMVTVIPHGPLFGLSFAALQDSRGQYLVERFTLHYAPSGAVLHTTREETAPPPASRYLLVADPLTPAADKLPRLPGALRETTAIRSLLPAGFTTMVSGSRASKAAITSLAANKHVLHFATHGVVSDERPLDSYLALAGGRLTAREIYGLDLDAQLVVLSACRSGSGKITGDGILGLSRAFFYAGTPTVIATVADVADVAADRTLPRFYRDWRRTGHKARALRDSQLAFLRALRAGQVTVTTAAGQFVLPEHPALWSPFVLIGHP